ncbi:MAG: phytoene/squalene synthase family protein [Bacteroidetes bacterium]|nr:MAG: phytoene/squalene synthase family protein [Bacteroidota bacterium]REK04803.1 MAG: phytoene/squalene synthase family protein [Bacteroidota bacterium]REK36276.1 MAG: phytoene/squalene synthase family protein [Bacteroidota bacterium]REK51060.1 MAG: phytoene/squalene synthase family protein [Bacteroidota bacterium]
MLHLYNKISESASRIITREYSTSFSLGILFLGKGIRQPVYSIYGFVRLADEIVDSFHGYDKHKLLNGFKKDTFQAIEEGISINPVLQAFQQAVHRYDIDLQLVHTFFRSMEMDLETRSHDENSYREYVLGSAEVVGLMCLSVFVNGDRKAYEMLKPSAMKLGSAFQKVNFLRDLKADHSDLGRTYFPGVDPSHLNEIQKRKIEEEIEVEFQEAKEGIRLLPGCARRGVYLAYVYYYSLFKRICSLPAVRIKQERIRISNRRKFALMLQSLVKNQFNQL